MSNYVIFLLARRNIFINLEFSDSKKWTWPRGIGGKLVVAVMKDPESRKEQYLPMWTENTCASLNCPQNDEIGELFSDAKLIGNMNNLLFGPFSCFLRNAFLENRHLKSCWSGCFRQRNLWNANTIFDSINWGNMMEQQCGKMFYLFRGGFCLSNGGVMQLDG